MYRHCHSNHYHHRIFACTRPTALIQPICSTDPALPSLFQPPLTTISASSHPLTAPNQLSQLLLPRSQIANSPPDIRLYLVPGSLQHCYSSHTTASHPPSPKAHNPSSVSSYLLHITPLHCLSSRSKPK